MLLFFEGEELRPECATGLDLFAPVEGNENDRDFFRKYSGKGERFPSGPTCFFFFFFEAKKFPASIASVPVDLLKDRYLQNFWVRWTK